MRLDARIESLFFDMLIREDLIKKGEYKGEIKSHLDHKIIKDKRKYRSLLKEEMAPKFLYHGIDGAGYGEIIKEGGDYDYFWRKVFFKGECWTDDEKSEFIENSWIDCPGSPYDCTGKIFTWAIDVFNVPDGVIAYIRYGVDV